ALPLRVRVGLLEMRDNCNSISPAPPLRLSHTVGQQIAQEEGLFARKTWIKRIARVHNRMKV
ncbi:MAG: hypothetical protein QME21_19440, partial [Anaerolineales bacterium]|nr:hypothetical protein [Anaerolineales bacterium]